MGRNKAGAERQPAGNGKYFRIIDANLNRCREGIRVIEDTARFVHGNEGMYRRLRSLRHRLDLLTRDIYPVLVQERDAQADSGRTIKEGRREGLSAVLGANFRRIEESLRVLEEYSKFLLPEAAPEFKTIRFKVYQMEKKFVGL